MARTESNATSAAIVSLSMGAAMVPHFSDSLVADVIAEGLPGFRTTSLDPVATARTIIAAVSGIAVKAKLDQDGIDSLDAAVRALPVAVAGRGGFTLEQVATNQVAMPEAGDLGYTVSQQATRGLDAGLDAEGKAVKKNGVFGLAVYPAYSVKALCETEEGQTWAQAILEKEMGLVSFRRLRVNLGQTTYGDWAAGAESMPAAMADFTTPTTTTGAASFELFNIIWPITKARLAKNPQAEGLLNALPSKKGDILSGIRSKQFAETLYPALESQNLFRLVANMLHGVAVTAANAATDESPFPYNPDDITRWLEGRNELRLLNTVTDTTFNIGDLDLESLMG